MFLLCNSVFITVISTKTILHNSKFKSGVVQTSNNCPAMFCGNGHYDRNVFMNQNQN